MRISWSLHKVLNNRVLRSLWQRAQVQLSRLLCFVLVLAILTVGLEGCASGTQKVRLVDLPEPPNLPKGTDVRRLSGNISEVAPPAVLLDLGELMDRYEPQVEIASPKADQILKTNQTEVKLKLKGLPIYKDEKLNLGPHIQLILDNQPARSVYSLMDPILFEDLAPGSHTLRAIATQPWGESFKNESAYSQTTFHVLAKTGENSPNADLPLITYLSPQGEYSAEPVLLDFYLNNAPLHAIAQQNSATDITDWKIRCSVNGQSFVFDQWQPIYLKGLTPGQNWIQLSLIDDQGRPIENAFNNTVHTFNYDPQHKDTLAKIVRGELPIEKVGQIAIRDYEPPIIPEPVIPESITPEPNAPLNGDQINGDQINEDQSSRLENESEPLEMENASEVQDTEAQDTEAQDTEAQNTEAQTSKVRSLDPKASASDLLETQIEFKDSESRDLDSGEVEFEDSESDILDQSVDDDDQSVENRPADQLLEDKTAAEKNSKSNPREQVNAKPDDLLPSKEPVLEEPDADVKIEEDLLVDDSSKETIFSRFSRFIDSFKEEKESSEIISPLLEESTPREDTLEKETDLNALEIPEVTETTESTSDMLLNDDLTEKDSESNNDEFIEDQLTEDDVSQDDSLTNESLTDETIEASEIENDTSPDISEASSSSSNAADSVEEPASDLNTSLPAPQSFFSQLKDRAKSFIQQSSASFSASTDQFRTRSPEEVKGAEFESLTPEANVEEIIPQPSSLGKSKLENDRDSSSDDAFDRFNTLNIDDFDVTDESEDESGLSPMQKQLDNAENTTALPNTLSAPDDIPSQVIIPVDPDSLDLETPSSETLNLESPGSETPGLESSDLAPSDLAPGLSAD